MFNEMQNRAAIEIKKTTQNWDAGNVISQCDYMGYYFMSSRDESVIVGYNRCYLIYKITVDITQYDVKKKKDVTDQCTYFYYVGFKDLKVDNDGNELFDNDLIVPVWLYTYESDIVTATFKNSTVCYNFSTNGADEFRMIFEDTVGFCYASYKYEDNITDYEYYDFEHSFYGPYGYNGYIYNQGGWYMY